MFTPKVLLYQYMLWCTLTLSPQQQHQEYFQHKEKVKLSTLSGKFPFISIFI
jgi:hypothetical protein